MDGNINSKFMKRIAVYFTTFLLCFIFSKCEDNRMDGMIDDRICLLKSDYLSVPVINFGAYEHPVVVSKSGIRDQEAVISFQVNSDYLDEYNRMYDAILQVLPADCYQLPGTLTIQGKELSATGTIAFNTQKIYDLQREKELYALPLEIVSENGIETYPGKNYVILSIRVEEATIGFYKPGLSMALSFNPGSPEEIDGYTEVDLNYTLDRDVSFQLQIEPDSVDSYNQKNDADYKVLPSSALTLKPEEWVVKAGEKTARITYKIARNKLITAGGEPDLGDYILPLRISEVSSYKIHQQAFIQLLHFNYGVKEFDKTGWMITGYNSCDNMDPGSTGSLNLPENIIDGNLSTYWRSMTDVATMKPLGEEPYFISFDMVSAKSVCQIRINQRAGNAGNRNLKAGYFEYNNDGTTWAKLDGSDFVWSSRSDTVQYVNVQPTEARQLKIIMTEGFSAVSAEKYILTLSELTVSGF
jgi:hypothetical protein